MIEDIMTDAQARMGKSVEALEQEFAKIRTGRAQTGVLDHITVPYYGSDTPLNQVAKVSVEDSRTLSITPFEKNMIQTVEKAIMASDLGLTPTTAGVVIRLPIPALTEERRRELTKMAKHESETARIAVRNIRRDANADLKELLKEKEISEDDERRGEEQIQKLTDRFVAEIDALLAEKEQDLMSI